MGVELCAVHAVPLLHLEDKLSRHRLSRTLDVANNDAVATSPRREQSVAHRGG